MSVQNLEIRYIRHLDELHFKGYADQLLFDNEKAFYKGMRQFLVNFLQPKDEIKNEEFEKIIHSQMDQMLSHIQEGSVV